MFGMELMSGAMSPLSDIPQFKNLSLYSKIFLIPNKGPKVLTFGSLFFSI